MERIPATLFTNCPWENGQIDVKAANIAVGNYAPNSDAATGPITLRETEANKGFSGVKVDQEIFKAFIPWFLYKPPYGFPRDANVLQLRLLAKNPYMFSVIKTIQDEVAAVPWDITLREEYAKDGKDYDDIARNGIKNFFNNPNGNDESFERLIRVWVRDICELDSGIGVKVFDKTGKFKQLFARDGGTFLKNTDIYGYLGDRAEFVAPVTQYHLTEGVPKNLAQEMADAKTPADIDKLHENVRSPQYDSLYRNQAAYFQYGWTAGARPVPFGKREIMWLELNPRSDSIYGRSPIEVLYDTILTLVYGGEYNLDFYLNNNLPSGLLTMKGASVEQANAIRTQMQQQFMADDEYGNFKKKHFKVPVTGYEVAFTQMQMSSKDMEVIAQQQWFTKIAWACFGVTPEEMGFTEDSNKAVAENQSQVAKRRAIKPFLSAIAYSINTQLMPEFEHPEFEFKFVEPDIDDDIKKHTLWKMQKDMGIRTAKQIATEELGMDAADFDAAQKESIEAAQEAMGDMEDQDPNGDNPNLGTEDTDNDDKKKKDDKGIKAEAPETAQIFEPKRENSTDIYEFVTDMPEAAIEVSLKRDLDILQSVVEKEISDQFDINSISKIKSYGGYIDVKGIVADALDKYENFLQDKAYKIKVDSFIDGAVQKGVETVENQIDKNVIIQTSRTDFMKDFVFENIKDMNIDLVNNLRKQISLGILNRESMDTVITRIRDIFKTTRQRATTIARTETVRAENMGSNLAAESATRDFGMKFKKKWDAHIDARTSQVCRDLNNTTVGMNEKFTWQGQEFDFPPAHPNCRSRVVYIQE